MKTKVRNKINTQIKISKRIPNKDKIILVWEIIIIDKFLIQLEIFIRANRYFYVIKIYMYLLQTIST